MYLLQVVPQGLQIFFHEGLVGVGDVDVLPDLRAWVLRLWSLFCDSVAATIVHDEREADVLAGYLGKVNPVSSL